MKHTIKSKFHISIKPASVDQALIVRKAYPQIFELRIWSLIEKEDFGNGPEKVSQIALISKN